MKIIAIVSQKGGAGKTTLAVHLAARAAGDGLQAVIVDLDPQATASSWGDWRGGDNPVVVAAPHTRLDATIAAARDGGADILFIDTPPSADAAAVAAAKIADLVLIPTRASAFDLHAIKTTGELMKIAQKPAYVVLNAVPPRSAALIDEAAEVIKSLSLGLAPACLVDRAAFRHAVINGQTAAEFEPASKAASEVQLLYTWMCGQVGMSTKKTPKARAEKARNVA